MRALLATTWTAPSDARRGSESFKADSRAAANRCRRTIFHIASGELSALAAAGRGGGGGKKELPIGRAEASRSRNLPAPFSIRQSLSRRICRDKHSSALHASIFIESPGHEAATTNFPDCVDLFLLSRRRRRRDERFRATVRPSTTSPLAWTVPSRRDSKTSFDVFTLELATLKVYLRGQGVGRQSLRSSRGLKAAIISHAVV